MRLAALFVSFALICSAGPGQARRGINDSGDCVTGCTRSGGRPCSPCFPSGVGPGDAEWASVVQEAKQNYKSYALDIRERAEGDKAYRRSSEYDADRKDAKTFGKAVEHLEKAARVRSE